jgi:hypothetical protein
LFSLALSFAELFEKVMEREIHAIFTITQYTFAHTHVYI